MAPKFTSSPTRGGERPCEALRWLGVPQQQGAVSHSRRGAALRCHAMARRTPAHMRCLPLEAGSCLATPSDGSAYLSNKALSPTRGGELPCDIRRGTALRRLTCVLLFPSLGGELPCDACRKCWLPLAVGNSFPSLGGEQPCDA